MVMMRASISLILLSYVFFSLAQLNTYLWNAKDLQHTKVAVKNGQLAAAVKALTEEANLALTTGPWSVMNKTEVPPSGSKHDYYSLAPYWWPCNWNQSSRSETLDCDETTGLPWVRRDGHVNPMTLGGDHDAVGDMIDAVTRLGLAYYFIGDEKYASRATYVLRTWFLDASTKMNPNLNFGQAVPGITTGRGEGLIGTRGFADLVNAITLLRGSTSWTNDDDKNIKIWFNDFLNWMMNSKVGNEEDEAKNNHGTWFDVQASSIALFVSNFTVASNIARLAPQKRVVVQIESDGKLPLELERTKSFGYSQFDLQAFFYLAILTDYSNVDLFSFSSDGRSIRKAFEFLFPYAIDLKPWPYEQIEPFDRGVFFEQFRIAANVYQDPSYESAIAKLPNTNYNSNFMVDLLYPKKTEITVDL